MNRFALTALLLASASCLLGCHCFDTAYTPSSCRSGWDPVFGSCDTCGTCGGDCQGHTPASYIGHKLTCASGCGEIYWGPWLNDPPDPCDPCDDCGDWVGHRPCEPNHRQKLVSGLLGGHHGKSGKGKGKGKACPTCDSGTVEVLPKDGPIEVLPPDPEPIEPAASSESSRRRFQFRSVRFER